MGLDNLSYKTVSASQAGAGTVAILAAPAAGYHYEVVWVAWEVLVAGAGTWTVQEAAPVVCLTGSTVAVHANNMPVGNFNVPAGNALNLVVATAGSVVVHVMYKLIHEVT